MGGQVDFGIWETPLMRPFEKLLIAAMVLVALGGAAHSCANSNCDYGFTGWEVCK